MEWTPGKKYRTILKQIEEVLSSGEQRTVRDVYYALEARGNKWEYRYVKRAVKKGRRAGYIDPSQIVDTSRRAENTPYSGYENPEEFVRQRVLGVWNHYNEDFWSRQDHYVEVWLEKQSLASVFSPICEELNVRLEATRGDWSDSKVYEATQRLRAKMEEGNDVRILYFGDFNPSGYHAPVSIIQTMQHYGLDLENWRLQNDDLDSGDSAYFDVEYGSPQRINWTDPDSGEVIAESSIGFERIGINLEHIEQFDLPENPTPSSSDKDRTIRDRFMSYVSEGKDTNVELNALKEYERDFLEDLIRDSIREYVDEEAKEEVEDRIERGREELEDAISVDMDAVPTWD